MSRHRNPVGAFTKKGERMYKYIKEAYGDDPRAKEIAARTVYARAGEGARGLRKKNPHTPESVAAAKARVKRGSRPPGVPVTKRNPFDEAVQPIEDDDHFVYGKARIYIGDLAEVAEICELWHGGRNSSCYALMSGDKSVLNLDDVHTELVRSYNQAVKSGAEYDPDDLPNLDMAIEKLESILDEIHDKND